MKKDFALSLEVSIIMNSDVLKMVNQYRNTNVKPYETRKVGHFCFLVSCPNNYTADKMI
jgi:hypothetical protein